MDKIREQEIPELARHWGIEKNQRRSVFIVTDCCVKCAWFARPYAPFSRVICPDCGDDLEERRGRFVIEKKTVWVRLLGFFPAPYIYDEYIRFEKHPKRLGNEEES